MLFLRASSLLCLPDPVTGRAGAHTPRYLAYSIDRCLGPEFPERRVQFNSKSHCDRKRRAGGRNGTARNPGSSYGENHPRAPGTGNARKGVGPYTAVFNTRRERVRLGISDGSPLPPPALPPYRDVTGSSVNPSGSRGRAGGKNTSGGCRAPTWPSRVCVCRGARYAPCYVKLYRTHGHLFL